MIGRQNSNSSRSDLILRCLTALVPIGLLTSVVHLQVGLKVQQFTSTWCMCQGGLFGWCHWHSFPTQGWVMNLFIPILFISSQGPRAGVPWIVFQPITGQSSARHLVLLKAASDFVQLLGPHLVLRVGYKPPASRPLRHQSFNGLLIRKEDRQGSDAQHQGCSSKTPPRRRPLLKVLWSWELFHQVGPISQRHIKSELLQFQVRPRRASKLQNHSTAFPSG